MKHNVWLEGGPHPDFQQLFTVGSGERLLDHKRLEEVLRRGASLQLVVTPPAYRCVSIYSGWCRPGTEIKAIPYFDKVAERSYAHVMGSVQYLGYLLLASRLRADAVTSIVRSHFLEQMERRRLILCIARDDSPGCAGSTFHWRL